jgi:hypothetical protein
MAHKSIKDTFIDPRGKKIIVYEQTWDTHILGGHPEMSDRYDDLKTTIEDPDRIREGRKPQTEELYVRNFISDEVFVSTRDIDQKTTTIVTSSYRGTDSNSRGAIKWSKQE